MDHQSGAASRFAGDHGEVRRPSSPWFHVPAPRPNARLRLFCFPHAGGNGASFHNWRNRLPADVEICAVELPGRRGRLDQPPFARMEPLLDALGPAIAPLLDRPFIVFGHSMGALVAFELIRRLRRMGTMLPMRFIASGCRAPQILDRTRPIHMLPDVEFLSEIVAFGGMANEILREPELIALVLPTLRADFELIDMWRYTPDAPLEIPIDAIGGTQDARVTRDDLEAWKDQTRCTFRLEQLSGGHFYFDSQKTALFELLSQTLA